MKLKFIIFLTLALILIVSPVKSFAQEYKNIPSFEMSHFELSAKITKSDTIDTPISILPITTINVKGGSFDGDVEMLIYKGKWDLLTLGSNKTKSPISAYYMVFLDSKRNIVIPKKPIEILVYNNYIKADAIFIPILKDTGAPDLKNTINFPNQAKVRGLLNANQSGFVVYINKVISKNDAALDPKNLLGPTRATTTPAPVPVEKNILKDNSIVILLGAIILISGLIIGILFIKYRAESEKQT